MSLSRIGAAIAEATTITIPGTYAAGDMIIIAAYRDGNATAPTLPAGWMPIDNQGANTNAMRLGYKYAASGSETSGTWTNATELACIVYRGAGGVMSYANGTASSTSLAFNALTMWNTDGNSWVAGFVGHRSINTSITTAPTGMTNQAGANGATAGIAVHDTNGGVASWSTQSVAAGGTASGWESYTLEIIPDTYWGIRQQQKATTGAAANLAITPQTTPVNGNLMLAFVAFANNVAAVTGPAGWTAIDNSSNAAGAGLSVWRKVASSESGAYTFTGSGASDSWSICFYEIPGANTTTPVDSHSLSHSAASGSTYATPSVTPATLSDMAFLAFTQDLDSTTFTVNGTTTRVGDAHPGSNHGLGVAIKSAPTADTVTGITQTWTGQASDTFVTTLLIAKATSGGTTLNVTVSDSSTVTEFKDVIRNNARDVTVSDSSTVTENVVKELTISANVNDSSTVTENVLRRLDASLSVSDASGITENTVVRLEANVNVSDSSTITENAVPFVTPLYINVNDASTVTENIVMLETSSVTVNDTSAITENVQRLETIAVTTSDASGITENTQFNEVAFINVNDSSGITENVTAQIPSGSDLSVTVSDSSAITENILRLETAFIAVSDSSGVTENIGRTLVGNLAVSDASAITENTTFLDTESITVSDGSGVTDTVSLYPNPLLISVSDSSTITESRFVNAGGTVATKSPGVIFLTDGRVAVRMGGNVYQPL